MKTASILFWAALTGALVLALVPAPPALPGDPSDKLQHMAAFAALALLAQAAYPRALTLAVLAGLSVFGGLIEIAQATPWIGRDADLHDWLADIVACAAALAAARVWRWSRRRSG